MSMSIARTGSRPERPRSPGTVHLLQRVIGMLTAMPESLIAFVARFSIAATFWKSGQTKVEVFAIDIVERSFSLGWPSLSASTVDLFRDEYRLPLIPPELAAPMAAFAEHLFPVLILLGFATRLSATALLVMTMVIQLFVYPDAYATHGTWAAVLLYLMLRGPGRFSVDHLVARRFAAASQLPTGDRQ